MNREHHPSQVDVQTDGIKPPTLLEFEILLHIWEARYQEWKKHPTPDSRMAFMDIDGELKAVDVFIKEARSRVE